MARQVAPRDFPSVNLMTEREKARSEKGPLVRTRFLVALAISVILLIAVIAAIQLVPGLVVPQ